MAVEGEEASQFCIIKKIKWQVPPKVPDSGSDA
jgi:hypothetical protein